MFEGTDTLNITQLLDRYLEAQDRMTLTDQVAVRVHHSQSVVKKHKLESKAGR